VRPKRSSVALYGFADASGCGFGSTLLAKGRVHYRHGQWSKDHSDESSNHRELDNLITAIEEAMQEGLLTDSELFMFTDNSTMESAFFKGTSTSPKLFDLILRLQELRMGDGLILYMIHVAGTQMKKEGMDGLSRGDCTEGVMRGQQLLSFDPLHLTTVVRAPQIRA